MKSTRFRPIGTIAGAALRADPKQAILALCLYLLAGIGPPLFAVSIGALADAVHTRASGGHVLLIAVALAVSVSLSLVISEMAWKVVQTVQERAAHVLETNLLRTVMSVPGIEHHERPDYLDKLDHLRDEQFMLVQALPVFLVTVELVAQLIFGCVLLARASPILLLLPLFAVPGIWANAKAEKIRVAAIEKARAQWRRTDYLLETATTPGPAKEIRVFGLGPELLRRHRVASRKSYEAEFGGRLAGVKWIIAGRLMFVVGYAGAVLVVLNRVIGGRSSIGELLLVMTLANQMLQQIGGVASFATWFRMSLTAVHRYLWVMDYGAQFTESANLASVPDRVHDGISFDHVTFSYPGTDKVILRDLNVKFPAGSTVALIGDNGAGKTTVVKLLTGMYQPTSGQITVDGTALDDMSLTEWRTRVSAAFQDHARFDLDARDVVGLGDLSRMHDDPVVLDAVERAGASDVVERLPAQLDTQLGASWPGGVDLSGGQWQKLALARGLMRDPLVLVLDEPTSALDAETEHSLFERFAAARDAARAAGTVTLLVSHRFSTVRMADLIVVLSGGSVVEAGSHAELMAADGLYAELYEMQARAYR